VKVIAIQPAFYNGARVRVGAEVDVPDNLKGSWFAKANTPEAKATKAPKPKAEPKALSELAKGDMTFNEAHKADLA
jgi:hypothetical protein